MKIIKSKSFEIKGTKDNPFHLSVGAVAARGKKIALIHKIDGRYTLLRETLHTNESIQEGIRRGLHEELGVEPVKLKKYLGELTSYHKKEGALIEKATIYFLVYGRQTRFRKPAHDEIMDTIVWVKPIKAMLILKKQKSRELEILKRIEL